VRMSVVDIRKLDPRFAFWITGTVQCLDELRAASAMITLSRTVSAVLVAFSRPEVIDWFRGNIDFSYSGRRQSRICICLDSDMFHVNKFVPSVPTTRSSDTSLLTHSAYCTPFTSTCLSFAAASGMRPPVKEGCALCPCGKATIWPRRRSGKVSFVGRCSWMLVQNSRIEVATSRGADCGGEFRPPLYAERLPNDVNTRGVTQAFSSSSSLVIDTTIFVEAT
jgi:hypothetical protein